MLGAEELVHRVQELVLEVLGAEELSIQELFHMVQELVLKVLGAEELVHPVQECPRGPGACSR